MKHIPTYLTLALLPLLALTSCSSTSDSSGSVNTQARSDADQVFNQINAYRVQNGKKPLLRHKGLDQLARKHSQYLCTHEGSFALHGKHVSHYGYENRVAYARAQFNMETMGENVGFASNPGSRPGPTLLSLWQDSHSHHKALLEDWTYTGVGTERGPNGQIYATQLFSTGGDNTTAAMRNRFNQFR